jgi:hypothetical protein
MLATCRLRSLIDKNDVLYSAGRDSNARRNQDYRRGLRIGREQDELVTTFIPYLEAAPDPDNTGSSATVEAWVISSGQRWGLRSVKKCALK